MFLSFFSIVLLKSITPLCESCYLTHKISLLLFWSTSTFPSKRMGSYFWQQGSWVTIQQLRDLWHVQSVGLVVTGENMRRQKIHLITVSWTSLFTWAKKIGISAIGYTGVKRKVIRIFFTYLTERICNNSPVDNGWKLYLFKVLCSTCLTQCSLRIPDVYCFVLSSFSKTIFPAIHGCNAAKCLTYPRFENGGKNSVFTVILQLSKWQVIEVSEESRSHRVSTTPRRAHWRYKVDIHQFTEGS